MIAQLLIWTVVVPLGMGLVLGAIPAQGGKAQIVLPALFPACALAAVLLLEGWPGFPPVAAKQKLPFVLLVFALLFGLVAARTPQPGRFLSGLCMAAVSIGPALWLGARVMASNPAKTAMILPLVFWFIALAAWTGSPAAPVRQSTASPAMASLFTLIATAVVSVTGGYIGMAQAAGAFAAITGGWLLIRYFAYLKGDDRAFLPSTPVQSALMANTGLAMIVTALFAPKASPAALILAALPLGISPLLQSRGSAIDQLPRAVRPIVSGLILGLPAVLALIISLQGFAA